METVLDDDDADDTPDPFATFVPTSTMFSSMVPPTVPRLQQSPLPQSNVLPRSKLPSMPTLGASPRSVPSGLSPCLHQKHVRLCRLRDQPTNTVTN